MDTDTLISRKGAGASSTQSAWSWRECWKHDLGSWRRDDYL